MALKRAAHKDFQAVDEEFQNIDTDKEGAFVWNATRAPNSSDKNARVWFFRNGATMAMYVYDSVAGAWRGPTNFT